MPRSDDEFRPTASLDALKARARMLRFTRTFFDRAGYCEVQTPLLSRDVLVDAHIEPIAVPDESGGEWFLQTSPEFAMKRILAAGADSIYQIGPAFRRGEAGRLHNPEFTMVEWYRNGVTYHDQMEFTERFVRAFAADAVDCSDGKSSPPVADPNPFERLTYDDAFKRTIGRHVLTLATRELIAIAREYNVPAPESLSADDRDGWLNLLLAELVEPKLGVGRPLFLYDYPASQSALAVVRDGIPPVAERFELYVNGIELCNGYQELTDADEFARRVAGQSRIRREDGRRALPQSSRLKSAMKAGLPECSGVALGFDRLLMLSLGLESVADVMSFAGDNA